MRSALRAPHILFCCFLIEAEVIFSEQIRRMKFFKKMENTTRSTFYSIRHLVAIFSLKMISCSVSVLSKKRDKNQVKTLSLNIAEEGSFPNKETFPHVQHRRIKSVIHLNGNETGWWVTLISECYSILVCSEMLSPIIDNVHLIQVLFFSPFFY